MERAFCRSAAAEPSCVTEMDEGEAKGRLGAALALARSASRGIRLAA